MNGIKIVAGFARERYEANRFALLQKDILSTSMKAHRFGIVLWMGAEFIGSVGLLFILWFGTTSVFFGRLTPGELMAIYTYLGILFFPIVKLAIVNNYYQEAVSSFGRIDKILSLRPKVKSSYASLKPRYLRGEIRFEDVSFKYETSSDMVLSNVSLHIKGSETIALVGRSGAGKTTLINLILRFYDPCTGEIFIDRYNLKDLDITHYRSKIGIVLQDDYLFNGTIKENILYSKPPATEDELIKAAKMAYAHNFIINLPDGYNTVIGERGVRLSYGQRQRISIARAILREPVILILDEATSNVDSESERIIIKQAYRNVMCGRTTIIIAHRLSTVTCADRIFFIENGKISESGSHSELLKHKGNYWRLWMQQSELYQDEKIEAEDKKDLLKSFLS